MKIFITGTSGYIGGMLADRYADRDDVDELICLDKNPMPARYKSNPKVLWIRANTADESWQELVASRKPDVVIHCAWQIREFYFRKKLHAKWNLGGTTNVFRFVFNTPSIKKLIHMSTVAAYGAYPDNTVERPFVESDPLREDEYLYGVQKKLSEQELEKQYTAVCSGATASTCPGVTVLRVASVTGTRYAQAKRGFTLQNILARIPYIPIANPEWGRQFVQEADLLSIFEHIIDEDGVGMRRTFNVAPPTFMKAADIVKAYGKRALYVPKEFMRFGFFILRHLSLGRLPTSRGGWRFYAYPLAVDGDAVRMAYTHDRV
ncbi:MAG: NAD-dependent epimerase/dehydratase family protein [Candidatus Uhrbacteria bacterium]|nr:NAD-dependent epimerase/dehydratase family protein [Candidatus Uhrbacteria bacterium]